MRKNDYLVCYDVSDPKRLAKLARFLEKRVVRIQNSIFLAKNFSKDKIYELSQEISDIINSQKDDIRIYTIKNYGINMGKAYNLKDIFLIY